MVAFFEPFLVNTFGKILVQDGLNFFRLRHSWAIFGMACRHPCEHPMDTLQVHSSSEGSLGAGDRAPPVPQSGGASLQKIRLQPAKKLKFDYKEEDRE